MVDNDEANANKDLVNTLIAEMNTAKDAGERFIRTFIQGLIVTVILAACTGLSAGLTSVEWTKDYWLALGGAILVNALTAMASYVMRYLSTPSNTSEYTVVQSSTSQ